MIEYNSVELYSVERFHFAERWLSGRRHTLGKRAYAKTYRGFESRSLRQAVPNRTPFLFGWVFFIVFVLKSDIKFYLKGQNDELSVELSGIYFKRFSAGIENKLPTGICSVGSCVVCVFVINVYFIVV